MTVPVWCLTKTVMADRRGIGSRSGLFDRPIPVIVISDVVVLVIELDRFDD